MRAVAGSEEGRARRVRSSSDSATRYAAPTSRAISACCQRLHSPYIRPTRAEWALETRLLPRTSCAIAAGTSPPRRLSKQRLTANPATGFRSTGFQAAINYTYRRSIVERRGLRALGVTCSSVESRDISVAPLPTCSSPFHGAMSGQSVECVPALVRAARREAGRVREVRIRGRVLVA